MTEILGPLLILVQISLIYTWLSFGQSLLEVIHRDLILEIGILGQFGLVNLHGSLVAWSTRRPDWLSITTTSNLSEMLCTLELIYGDIEDALHKDTQIRA